MAMIQDMVELMVALMNVSPSTDPMSSGVVVTQHGFGSGFASGFQK